HGEGADGEDGLPRRADAAVVVAADAVFLHRVLDGLSLADEIEHHHRMRQERDHRGEDAERDVTRHVVPAQPEHDGRYEAGHTEHHCTDKRLRHSVEIMTSSPDHLLEPGEQRHRRAAFDVMFYEEVLDPGAVARIVAWRAFSRSNASRGSDTAPGAAG